MNENEQQVELFDDSVVVEEEKPKTVRLDPPVFEIDLNVGSDDKPKVVSAMINAPAPEQDYEYGKKISTSFKTVGNKEHEIKTLDEDAGSELFDKCVKFLKGFVLRGESSEQGKDWRDAEPLKALIPSTWKAGFIRGTRVSWARLIDNDECVVLGPGETLEVHFGTGYEPAEDDTSKAVVTIFVPEPQPSEIKAFNDHAMKWLHGDGQRLLTNVEYCSEFFLKLMERPGADILGGTVGGRNFDPNAGIISRKAYLLGINPVYRAKIIISAMTKYNARLGD